MRVVVALFFALIFLSHFLTLASLVTAFALVLLLDTETVSTCCWLPSAVIDAMILWQKNASLFFSWRLTCIVKNHCFDFRHSWRYVLSHLLTMLPYGIAFCAFFLMRISAIACLSSDSGIAWRWHWFHCQFFYDVMISGFDASSDACFPLGAGIFY